MTDAQFNAISLAVLIPSLVVIVLVSAGTIIGPPAAVVSRQRRRQRLSLAEAAQEATGDELRFDWMRYKHMSKQQILDVTAKYGWVYVEQWQRNRSWILRFARREAVDGPTQASQPSQVPPNPQQRLVNELATASTGRTGLYRVKTYEYAEVDTHELERIVVAAGWHITRRVSQSQGELLVLTRSGTSPIHVRAVPGVGNASINQYRDNNAVSRRISEMINRRGVDPLSDAELDRVMSREKHWEKRSIWARVLLVVGVCVGPAVLLVNLRASGVAFQVGLAIGLAFLVLGAAAMLWYRIVRRRRRDDIGAELEAYTEIADLFAETSR